MMTILPMGARGVIEFSVDSAFGYLKIEQK
jgi:hypothetical protein